MRLRVSSLPMPRRITLRHKLASLVGGIGVLIVILTIVGVANLGNVSDHGQRTFTRVTKPLASLGRARALLNENAALADRHMLEQTLPGKQRLEQEIAANDRAVDHELALAAPTLTTAVEREKARIMRADLATYRATVQDLFKTSRANATADACEWSARILDPTAERMNSDLQALFDAKVAEGNQLADEASATYHSARRLALILLALAFLIGVPACVFIIRGIRKSAEAIVARLASLRSNDVAGLRAGLDRLAEGDLTFELTPVTPPITCRTRDEIGDIAEAVGEIRDHTVASVEAYNASRAALATMIGQVSQTATALSTSSRQLAAGSEETGRAVAAISASVDEVAAGAERQVRALTSARELVEDAAATVQSAADAQETATAADEAKLLAAAAGGDAVREATGAMGAARDASSAATAAMAELGAKSAQITGVHRTRLGHHPADERGLAADRRGRAGAVRERGELEQLVGRFTLAA